MEKQMSDIFMTWREALSAGCRAISEDEACAGYFRIPAGDVFNGVQDGGASHYDRAWLPVALWQDAETDHLVGLVDGEAVNPSVIWPIVFNFVFAKGWVLWPQGWIACGLCHAGER